ncbi:MAG: glycosyltransferase [Clostridiales bacterium]|nr:glycosyltransferase [Clostridiales bacterium]
MSVRVSVVVPVYNAEKYLKECFDSLVGVVNFNDIEVVAVDDGSVDGSAAICDDYAGRYKNFRVIHQPNGGVSAARNAGIEAAVGEFIGFSDADDYVYPEIYKTLLDSADEYKTDLAVCCFIKELKDGGTQMCGFNPGNKPFYSGDEVIREIVYKAMTDSRFNSVYNKLFSREIIMKNNVRFPRGKKYGEDRDFILSFLSGAEGVSFSNYAGYFYRYVESGAINRARNDYVETLLAQYYADLRSFSVFNIEKSVIEENCGVSLIKGYISAFWIADERSKGKEKINLFRSAADNAGIRDLFEKWYDKTFESELPYNRKIMAAVLDRNVSAINRIIQFHKLSERIKTTLRKFVRRSGKN